MQLISSVSKFLFFTVLSCALIIALSDSSTDIQEVNIPATTNVGNVRSVDSVWMSMGRDFRLDDQTQTAQVQAAIRNLLADQTKLNQILWAAAPYIYYIHQQTAAHGLPAELALIPFIESEFNPNNLSDKGALGLWQLMSGTAHELRIPIKSGYDGRRNVVDSTHAALAYFRDLGNQFNGNWYLAIAAYNCGQGKVASVERKAGSDNFWNLPLPKETKSYVPQLLAVAAIIKNPEKYGVQLPPIVDKPYFAEVKLKKQENFNQISKTVGISVQDLHALNPDYKNGVVSKAGDYSLLVPIDKLPVVEDKLDLPQA